MDDFSRFILSWELQVDMTAASLVDVVQEAVDATGMTDVPVEDRTVPLFLGQRLTLKELHRLSGSLDCIVNFLGHEGTPIS